MTKQKNARTLRENSNYLFPQIKNQKKTPFTTPKNITPCYIKSVSSIDYLPYIHAKGNNSDPLFRQAIAKRVDTLAAIGYILDFHHCLTCFPPPPLINVEPNSQ